MSRDSYLTFFIFLFSSFQASADTVAQRLDHTDGCSVLKLGEGAYNSNGDYSTVVDYAEYPAYLAQGFEYGNNCTNLPYNKNYNFPVELFYRGDGWINIARELGSDDADISCRATSKQIADPINISTGNVFLREQDYPPQIGDANSELAFSRYYNSATGHWTHSYASHLMFGNISTILVDDEGRDHAFVGDALENNITESGVLEKNSSSWIYKSSSEETMTFNMAGELIDITNPYSHLRLSRDSGYVTVTDSKGNALVFSEDSEHRPLTLKTSARKFFYGYDSKNHLTQVSTYFGDLNKTRSYAYDSSNGMLLNITDERGLVISSWTYDSKGRAVSNTNSAGGTTLIYESGRTKVLNELGKQTVYNFTIVNNVSRISSVDGEPSANCPASNSSYTYDNRGRVLTKTDAKGFITTYTYNDRGLEVSRIEASGTPQARVTTTEWDPTRFLRTKVVEPTRTTVYTYDDQGRETGRQVSAR